MAQQRSGLQWDIKNISVAGGVETKTHPKLVESPKTTTADNVIYTTNGAARKRNGYTGLSTTVPGGTAIAAGLAVGVVGAELVQANKLGVYGYSSTTSNWQQKGVDSAASVTTTPLLTTTVGNVPSAVSSATIGNYQMVAYANNQEVTNATSSSVYVGVFDTTKGAWLYVPVVVANSADWPVVVAYGNYFYLYYITANNVVPNPVNTYSIRFDSTTFPTAFTVPAATVLVNGATTSNTSFFALDAVAGTDGKLYVYTSTGAAAGGILWTYATPGASPTLKALAQIDGPCTIAQAGTYIVLANASGAVVIDTTTQTEAVKVALSFPNAGTLVTCSVALVNSTYYACFSAYATSSAAGVQNVGYIMGTLTSTRTLTLSGTYCRFPWPNRPTPQQPVAKAVYDATTGKFLQWIVAAGQQSTTLQPTLYLAGLTPTMSPGGADNAKDIVYARALYNTAGQAYKVATGYFAPRTLQTPGAGLRIAATTLGVTLISIALTTGSKSVIPLSNGALITGTRPMLYDGIVAQVAGFDGFPELPPAANFVPTTGGSMTPGTSYQYSAVYSKTDAYGDTIYSTPTPPVTVTLSSSQNAVTITPPANTGWPTSLDATTVSLYRTQAASLDALDFRLLATMPTGSGAYTDNAADTALGSFLYSTPTGEIGNDPPPPCSVAVATQNRIFVIAADNPTRIYYSKPFNSARGAVEFSALQYLNIDPATGPCTALGTLDNKVIIFKNSSIYLLDGAGPDATGNGTFNPIVRLAADDGCTAPGSVLTTADGVYFLGNRGISIVTRQGLTEYIGAPVETLLAARTVVTALYVPSLSHARFYLDNGTAVVYDTFLKRWSTFSNFNNVVAVTLYGGNPATLTSAGVVNVENTGFTDNGAAITMTLETGWIPVTQNPQGWGRLRRVLVLGTYKSSHTATLSFAYDWDGYIDSVAFSSAAGLLNGDTVEQWRTRTKRQVMQSIRLKLVDSAITGESYDIVGLALEIATKAGTAKLPQAKSV